MNFFRIITHAIFPEKCVGCGASDNIVCVSCVRRFPPAVLPEFSWIMSVFAYTHPPIRRLIHMLKYENRRSVARLFAPYLLASLIEFVGEEKLFLGAVPVVLVPVPLSKKRQRSRGYNQSELLIREIVQKDSAKRFVMDTKLVAKIKDTVPQAQIQKKTARLVSQNDCFRICKHKRTMNEVIILVDDVTTTGATLASIRTLLKENGFKKVYALTIAH